VFVVPPSGGALGSFSDLEVSVECLVYCVIVWEMEIFNKDGTEC